MECNDMILRVEDNFNEKLEMTANSENLSKFIPSSQIMKAQYNQKEKHITPNSQNLNISDYEAFMEKSKQEERTDYPSVFRFIQIIPTSDLQLISEPKENISPLNCTRKQLIQLAVEMIMENNFAKQNLDFNHTQELITTIAQNYNSIPYHNFSHGFALMQMLYKSFKMDDALKASYSDEQLTYYLIAGITHDVDHRGTNNGYEVKMRTELAQIAQNDAVLEKMHMRTFLEIIRSKPQFDVLSKSSKRETIKQKMTRVILATDMAKHFKNLLKMTNLKHQGKLHFQNQEVKIVFMQNLAHACDIGNSLLPFEQYLNWGSLLSYQFNEQTKLEAQNNIDISQFLKYKGFSSFYDDQIGFLGSFVIPLWKQIGIIFPKINPMIKNSQENLAKIKEMKEQSQT